MTNTDEINNEKIEGDFHVTSDCTTHDYRTNSTASQGIDSVGTEEDAMNEKDIFKMIKKMNKLMKKEMRKQPGWRDGKTKTPLLMRARRNKIIKKRQHTARKRNW